MSTTIDNCDIAEIYLGVHTQFCLASSTPQTLVKNILKYSNVYKLGKSSQHFITVRGLNLIDARSPLPFGHVQARHKFPFKK